MSITLKISEADMARARKGISLARERVTEGVIKALTRNAFRIEAEAKQNLTDNGSVATGTLRRSIRAFPAGLDTAVSTNVEYAEFVEHGTAPHVIRPTNAKALRFQTSSGVVFATKVNHPGTRAKPFMHPAYEKNRPQLIKELTEALND